MYENKKILALIPARSGSKGVPNKNIKLIAGKPLLFWTVEAAKKCAWLDKIIVSTDDPKIATLAKQAGAEVPFLRPKELSSDSARMIDVLLHAIDWFEKHGENYDLLLLLQPTSPLRSSEDIKNAIMEMSYRSAKAIISVCPTEHPPYWSNVLPPDHSLKHFIDQAVIRNRQELPEYYRLNGAIYLSDVEYLKKNSGFWGDATFAYIMPVERSVDIDSEIDFKLAEILLKEKEKE